MILSIRVEFLQATSTPAPYMMDLELAVLAATLVGAGTRNSHIDLAVG
jgi:hypothetical protein